MTFEKKSDTLNPLSEETLLNPESYPPQSSNLLFVLSGPSGVGKDTLISHLKQEGLPLHFTVTMTTRQKRPGEIHGVNYFFVSNEEFMRQEREGELLEWALVHGNYYGTPLQQVREALDEGHDVLLKIDVQGAQKVKERLPQAVFIFLAPPSIRDLVQRLTDRGTESTEEQARRLRDAYQEMHHLSAYDYMVVNPAHRIEEAIERIKAIIVAEKCRVKPRRIVL